MYVSIYACIYVCVQDMKFMYACTYVCMYVCMYLYVKFTYIIITFQNVLFSIFAACTSFWGLSICKVLVGLLFAISHLMNVRFDHPMVIRFYPVIIIIYYLVYNSVDKYMHICIIYHKKLLLRNIIASICSKFFKYTYNTCFLLMVTYHLCPKIKYPHYLKLTQKKKNIDSTFQEHSIVLS